MAAKTDLNFDELNAALGVEAFYSSGEDVVLSVSALTGNTFTALTDEGVIKLIYKLRSACSKAQDTANEGLEPGQELLTFSGFSFSAPDVNGYVTVTQSHTVRIPLDTNNVQGRNP